MRALQQELDLKEAEMEELLMQLAEIGSNQMRSEGEKAELRLQYEERIRQGEAKVGRDPGILCTLTSSPHHLWWTPRPFFTSGTKT